MQVEVDVKGMQANFGGHGLFSFGAIGTLQIWPNIVHGGQKIELAQKKYASRG